VERASKKKVKSKMFMEEALFFQVILPLGQKKASTGKW
jgi:hypothetical protein